MADDMAVVERAQAALLQIAEQYDRMARRAEDQLRHQKPGA
jgi:hypothetical protein